jgi:hypothetical protein
MPIDLWFVQSCFVGSLWERGTSIGLEKAQSLLEVENGEFFMNLIAEQV